MSLAQRIPTAAWDSHKEQIRMLYVVQDKTLDDTIKSMNEDHGFLATKSQYVRKLKNWGMEKYINGEKWKIAFNLMQKRKRSGKETELSIDGKVIPLKKMKKEMGRYSYSQCGLGGLPATPTDSSSGIIAYTPPSDDVFRITFNTIPWLRFQNSVGSVLFRSGNEYLLPRVEDSHPSGITNPVPELEKALLAYVNRSDNFSALPSILEEKAKAKENNCQIQQLLQSQPVLRILQHAVYMSSNSFLSSGMLCNLTDWIFDNGYCWAIESFVRLEGPSVAIFASNLLLSAIDCQKVVLVRALLVGGANPNNQNTSPSHHGTPGTALYRAVQTLNPDLVDVLLRHGADPNDSGSSHHTVLDLFGDKQGSEMSALGGTSDHLRIFDMLIKAGAKVSEFGSPFTAKCLTASLKSGKVWLVGLAAKAGASTEFIGNLANLGLQSAIQGNDSDEVRASVDHGADINSPSFYLRHPHKSRSFEFAKPIGLAASMNNFSMVQLLLELGANANGIVSSDDLRVCAKGLPEDSKMRDSGRIPALHHAIRNGNTAMAELLLQWGANKHTTDGSGNTPLQAACASKQLEMAGILLRQETQVNAAASLSQDIPALQAAIASGSVKMVKLLLRHGGITNSVSSATAALRAAVKKGVVEFVALLLDADADVLHHDSSIVHFAVEHSAPLDMVRHLLNAGAHVEDVVSCCEPPNRRTPLHMAVQRNNLALVKLLLEYGADISHVKGITPCGERYEEEVQADWVQLVLTLVEHGVDINSYSSTLKTCSFLQAAISVGDFAMIRFLLDRGANPNSCLNPDELHPLHGIMEIRNEIFVLETLNTLIALGADISTSCFLDQCEVDTMADMTSPYTGLDGLRLPVTPLQAAVYYGHRRAVGVLLQAGANIDALAAGGFSFTALQVAIIGQRIGQHDGLVDFLLEAGANINAPAASEIGFTALQAAILTNKDDLANRLLLAGAEINAPGALRQGITALQAAVLQGNGALIQQLLSRGADINASPCGHRGATALQYAAMNGNFDLVVQLLENGADINAACSTTEGRTALEGAAEHGRLDIVHLLLENDHEVELLEERCREAAEFASEEGHIVIAELLREWKKP
ncbi:ankyrin repeat-containing domain protein [Ilyonectria sp. MPI-CAGE-AT-0026]|nr:ankyrin repeat-containing domain protein [Ilyonectria sp. MPI-CAGE-AT-0026]